MLARFRLFLSTVSVADSVVGNALVLLIPVVRDMRSSLGALQRRCAWTSGSGDPALSPQGAISWLRHFAHATQPV